MATIGGPNLEKDNLVFGYDTGYGVADNNTATRFYPGEPSANLLPSGPASGTGDFSRQSAHNESFTYSKVTNYRGRADVHRLYINPTGNTADPYADFGGQHHKSGGSVVGDVYAVSLDFYVAKGNNSPSLSSVYANGYKSPSSAQAASFSSTSDVDLGGGWIRRTRIMTITTAGNTWLRFGCNTSGNETEVYVDNVQIELKSHATPFVDGTRSSTQSLIDLKRNTSIDVSNVSFDSTGQPDFDGTDDRIVASPSNISLGTSLTMEVWIYPTGYNHSRMYLIDPRGDGNTNGTNAYFLFDYHASPDTVHVVTGNNNIEVQSSNFSMPLNNWHNIVATRNGNSWVIYHNGVSVGTGTTDTTSLTLNNDFRIGTYASGTSGQYFFEGLMAVAKFYNIGLSAEQVKHNYNAYKNRFDI